MMSERKFNPKHTRAHNSPVQRSGKVVHAFPDKEKEPEIKPPSPGAPDPPPRSPEISPRPPVQEPYPHNPEIKPQPVTPEIKPGEDE